MQQDEQWQLARKREHLRTRAGLIQAVRSFFVSRHFLEVETPIRLYEIAPESSIDAIPSEDWYLQTSPELCMKRLLSAGYGRIFQLSKCFRRGERGRRHLPEFTMLEWYEEGLDYRGLMERCEELFLHVARELGREGSIDLGHGRKVSLEAPWERITLAEAFEQFASCSLEEALTSDRFDELLVVEVEPNLGREKPAFLCDYPVELGALARRKPGSPEIAERFELYLDGVELANGFSELTDYREQRHRFEMEQNRRVEQGLDRYPEPERFLASIAHLPESAGIALGIDRLAMLFSNAGTIDEVVAFTPEMLRTPGETR